MKVRLLAQDSKQPNIALMKISTYWKNQGADVGWYAPLFDSQDTNILYESRLIDFTPEYNYYPDCEIIRGGTGIDIAKQLPPEIDKITKLDYSLYPDCDYSMQFYSRGCIRNCPFCVVRQKEGGIHPTNPMDLNPNGKRIEILDNNFFANPLWETAIEHIKDIGQPVNMHGVDIRIMNEKQADALMSIKHSNAIHFAWDQEKDEKLIIEKLKMFKEYTNISQRKTCVYVLTNFDTDFEYDLYRLYTLRELGYDPYVMIFDKPNAEKRIRLLQRWVNNKIIWKSCARFEDYNSKLG